MDDLNPEVLKALVEPMLNQESVYTLYAATCCNRVYVGMVKPLYCQNHPDQELDVRIFTAHLDCCS